jgi:pimeloyl-ACP methyl ester carboxylesterase
VQIDASRDHGWLLRVRARFPQGDTNARLLTVDGAGHAPWIEDPERVLPAIASFLDGTWPDGAEQVTSLVPATRDGR